MNNDGNDQEIVAIRGVVADADRLQSDLDGYIGLLTEDAVIVNFGGRRVRGRDRVYEAMKQALATPLAKVFTSNELEDIRFVRPDVALVGCLKHISDRREPPAEAGQAFQEHGRMTYMLVKERGRWLIASAQTTPIQ